MNAWDPDTLRRRAASESATLLSELGWIRRLARRLVLDEERAEDLVQDTCVVLLEKAPRDEGRLRRWVATVMRNLVRQRVRGEARRSAREALERPRTEPEAPGALVERVAMQRQLTEAVLGLHEPYQSTILLRFFEELAPREIARRQGVPVATVQSRLHRGLALLRRKLDDSHGRELWAGLLLPTLAVRPPVPLTVAGGLLVNAKVPFLVAAMALSVGWMVLGGGESPVVSVAAGTADDPQAPRVPRDPGSSRSGEARREEVARSTETPSTAGPTPVKVGARGPDVSTLDLAPVRARVLDDRGEPLAGVWLKAEEGRRLQSGPLGEVIFETSARALELIADDPAWVTVRAGRFGRGGTHDPVVIVARALHLEGRVMDEQGTPVPGRAVTRELPRDFHAPVAEALDATAVRAFQTQAAGRGHFRFERVPAVHGAALLAVAEGYLPARVVLPELPRRDLELVLERPELPLAGHLRGRVVDPRGRGVAGARVACGLASGLSGEDGEFSLDLRRAATAERLTAVKEGFLPSRLERPGPRDTELGGWPVHVTLTLAEPAERLVGRVVDHRGQPVVGARVWLADPTPSSPVGDMPVHLEHLMAGAPVPAAALRSLSLLPEEDGDQDMEVTESAGAPSALWNWIRTDADGSFELPGLDRRPYRLAILGEDSLERVEVGPFDPRRGPVTVELPAPDLIDVVAGRVRSTDGRPLAGVRVRAVLPVVDVRGRVFGGRSRWSLFEPGPERITDEEGRFRFEDLPRAGIRLSLQGDGILPTARSLEDEARPRALEFEVDLRCHLEVRVADPERADRVRIVDGAGEPLEVLLLTEGEVEALDSAPLVGGRTGVVSVSSAARELWLCSGAECLERRPIDLLAGQVTEIRW